MERLYNRSLLSEPLREIYDQLQEVLAEHGKLTVFEDVKIKRQIKTVYEAVLFDNPMFLMQKTFTFPLHGDIILMQPEYMYSHEESARVRKRICAQIDQIIDQLRLKQLSKMDRLQALCQFFRQNVIYDEKQANNHLAESALLPPYHSVCCGISIAFRLFCARVGINAAVIGGSSGLKATHNHAWNLVEIDGRIGHVDLTNDLQDVPGYFMLSDETLRKERWFPPQPVVCEGLPLPENKFRVVESRAGFQTLLSHCEPQTCLRVKVDDPDCVTTEEIRELINRYTSSDIQTYSIRVLNEKEHCFLIRLKSK